MKKGKVLAVNISKQKGEIKKPVDQILAIEDFGFEGDAHGGPGKRQVSLLGIESVNKMKSYGIEGLCFGKFAENITTEGLELYSLPVGTKVKIGESVQEISQIGKKCHAADGCEVARLVGTCIMPKEGIFTKVIKGGIIKPGDSISVIE